MQLLRYIQKARLIAMLL